MTLALADGNYSTLPSYKTAVCNAFGLNESALGSDVLRVEASSPSGIFYCGTFDFNMNYILCHHPSGNMYVYVQVSHLTSI